MKIPNPYFIDVPKYGNLHVDEILLEDVYPILFTLKNENEKKLFICLCCEIRNEQRWILNPITVNNLIALLTNKITVREAFTDGKDIKIVAIRNYATECDSFKLVTANEFDADDLPNSGELLDTEDGEFDEYIKRLESLDEINNAFSKINKSGED